MQCQYNIYVSGILNCKNPQSSKEHKQLCVHNNSQLSLAVSVYLSRTPTPHAYSRSLCVSFSRSHTRRVQFPDEGKTSLRAPAAGNGSHTTVADDDATPKCRRRRRRRVFRLRAALRANRSVYAPKPARSFRVCLLSFLACQRDRVCVWSGVARRVVRLAQKANQQTNRHNIKTNTVLFSEFDWRKKTSIVCECACAFQNCSLYP